MSQFPLFDDVGSFPLPENIDKEIFQKFYWIGYKALVKKSEIYSNKGIQIYFIKPMLKSFELKLNAGVEIINYPQHMNMYTQFLQPISDFEIKPNLIDEKKALIPEAFIIENYAKKFYEETGKSLKIKLCITGPIDLYIKQFKFSIYPDIVLNFAKSINFFLKNSVRYNKYLHTSIISIDEPSFGYVDIVNITEDDLIKIYDRSLEGIKTEKNTTQMHIHTLNRADIPLKTKNFDVITCEYASNRSNKISKKLLEQYDKFIRVGITRTNIDNIIAEKIDNGTKWEDLNTQKGTMSLIDSEETIRRNLLDAISHYGDRLKFIGPDCGLGGWRFQEVAFELLRRTKKVIENTKREISS
ncbi:MAG: hypothetical protein ACFFEO_13925 [Candidatus Thorarchaeota archaeon]